MRIKTLGLLSLFALLGAGVASTAYAQSLPESLHVIADVPFAFHAGSKTLPAGHYEFTGTADGAAIRVAGKEKGEGLLAPIETVMASEVHGHASDTHVVFDDVNGVYTLSEIWESGFDGVLLHATKGPHKHRVITSAK